MYHTPQSPQIKLSKIIPSLSTPLKLLLNRESENKSRNPVRFRNRLIFSIDLFLVLASFIVNLFCYIYSFLEYENGARKSPASTCRFLILHHKLQK